ncbi:hypothetical protein CCP4SC76_5550009 [Gammaproteobacteria bacterium]
MLSVGGAVDKDFTDVKTGLASIGDGVRDSFAPAIPNPRPNGAGRSSRWKSRFMWGFQNEGYHKDSGDILSQ